MKILVKVDPKKIDKIITGLKYVSSLPLAKRAFDIDSIKKRMLAYLKSIFPVSDPRWGNTAHLVTGFRAYDIPENNGKVGFVIQHANIGNVRIAEILMSLEQGSRGYYERPKSPYPSGYGLFTFIPGDGRGVRNGVTEGADFAMRKRIHIPSRTGQHYLGRTLEFAQSLVDKAKPEYFKKVKEAFKNR